jgi:hypothetical protein
MSSNEHESYLGHTAVAARDEHSLTPPYEPAQYYDREGYRTIVSFNHELTQNDLGFVPEGEPGLHNVDVHADRVGILEDLSLRGHNLTVIARRLEIREGVTIDTSGPAPAKSFVAGQPAVQVDPDAGADGSVGASGMAGADAGNLTLRADEIVVIPGEALLPIEPTVRDLDDEVVSLLHMLLERDEHNVQRLLSEELATHSSGTQGWWTTQSGDLEPVSIKLTHSCHGDEVMIRLRWPGNRMRLSLPLLTLEAQEPTTLEASIRWTPGASGYETTVVTSSAPELVMNNVAPLMFATAHRADRELREPAWQILVAELSTLVDALAAALVRAYDQRAQKRVVETHALGSAAPTQPNVRLLAQGGLGGRGQDGHRGMDGTPGRDGPDFGSVSRAPAAEEFAGQPGGHGGRGGSAGRSGDGGAGGNVLIHFREARNLHLEIGLCGGLGGLPALAGAPGRGGRGGKGGSWAHPLDIHGGGRGERGADGSDGARADFQGAEGAPGKPGRLRFHGAPAGDEEALPRASFAEFVNIELLLLTQRQTRLLFLGAVEPEEFERCVKLYAWLLEITEPFTADDPAAQQLSADEHELRRLIHEAALLELNRLSLGLDYFGHRRNWAPAWSTVRLRGDLDRILANGASIEDEYRASLDHNRRTRARVEKLLSRIDSEQRVLAAAAETEALLRTQLEETLAHIEQLGERIVQQESVIRQHEVALQVAFDHQRSVDQFFLVARAVITIGSSLHSITGAIGAVTKVVKSTSIRTDLPQALSQDKAVIKSVKTVGSGFSGLVDLYNQISEPRDHPDSLKLVVPPEDYTRAIERHLRKLEAHDFEETRHLRRAIETLLELHQTRNGHLLDYTGMVAERALAAKRTQQAANEKRQLAALLSAASVDVVPNEVVSFLGAAYGRLQERFVDNLYALTRAVEYEHGMTPNPRFAQLSIGVMSAMMESFDARLQTMFDNTQNRFEIDRVRVELKHEDYPDAYAELASTGVFRMRLDPEHEAFKGMWNIKFRTVEIEVEGSQTSGFLPVDIELSGDSIIRVASHPEGIVFAPGLRRTFFRRNLDSQRVDIRPQLDANGYAVRSPFTLWTLEFGDLGREIRKITLILSGSAYRARR